MKNGWMDVSEMDKMKMDFQNPVVAHLINFLTIAVI